VQLRFGEALGHGGGYVPGKALQNRCHAQLALTSQNLLRQLFVLFDPVLRQGPTPAIQAAHPLKR
jgi:hypothetical protein